MRPKATVKSCQQLKTERNRILDRCSSPATSVKHVKNFSRKCTASKWLQQQRHNQILQETNPPHLNKSDNTNWLCLKIPFISKQIDNKISNIFRNKNLKVRLTHRSHSLRHALDIPKTKSQCKSQQWPIAYTGNCLKRNRV